MSRTGGLVSALAAAGAFSSFPSPYYHRMADATGSRWTTVGLFVVHGVASFAAMSALARLRPARSVRPGSVRLLRGLLLLDAAGGLLLVAAPAPAGVPWLLAGRAVTGAALGALTPVATAGLSSRRHGTALATAAIIGGVGLGALLAGGMAAGGLSRAAVFGVGLIGLLGVAALVRTGSGAGDTAGAPARGTGTGTVADGTGPRAVVLRCALLAFAANGVLGLFTSILPGLVADRAGGAELVAGATAGLVMLAAGAARLALLRVPANRTGPGAVAAAVTGAALFAAGLGAGTVPASMAGGVLLGAAAGVGYDAALRITARLTDGVGPLAQVQRGGQLGLVLPVVAYPLLVPP
ncbi:hypothetical protein ABZS66_04935 [Dactylosporangium sp. NPDC005572]|uniref:hypothetical protein n=1 Tax=Dactylosporangium sp. NPDC005572 TaxID=3156889 RepID=UPI0033A14A42